MNKGPTIALFGEAERGEFETAILCTTLHELLGKLGEPPPDSLALHFAVQALHFHQKLLFYRVREEGFSSDDYLVGLKELQQAEPIFDLQAICAPGVGDHELIDKIFNVCRRHESLLITSEKDLYDYLTTLASL